MPEKKILKINQSYIESWYKAAVVNHWSGVKFYQLEYIKMFFFLYTISNIIKILKNTMEDNVKTHKPNKY